MTKPKLWQNSNSDKTQIVTKLKLWEKKSKTQIRQNSDCDSSESSDQKIISQQNLKKTISQKTQKLKLRWNSKPQMLMKLKNSNCDLTQKLKLWTNSKTQILTKLWNSNCDKTQNWNGYKTQKLKLWQNS